MLDKVVLGSSLGAQLFSMRKTAKVVDATQLRLATGLRVNSAIENPQNFFSSKALNNRASDLARLLDGIGQNIQVIKTADAGITALTDLVEQAEATAQQARDLLPTVQREARATGEEDLGAIDDLTNLSGVSVGDSLRLTFRDREDETFNPAAQTVTIAANMSGQELIHEINDLNTGLADDIIEAALNDDGQLELTALDGNIMMVEFVAGVGTGTQAGNQALAGALGFDEQVQFSNDLLNQNSVGFVIYPDAVLSSFEFQDLGTGEAANRSSSIANLRTESGFNPFFGTLNAGDQYEIGVNGGAREVVALDNTITVQGFIDAINNSASVNEHIQADFIADTGQITITVISGDVEDIQLGVSSNNIAVGFLGFDARAPVAFSPAFASDITSIQLPEASDRIDQLEAEFDSILDQIDALVGRGDTGYRGTNLLAGDGLETVFNETYTSSLVTEGFEFTASGLGLSNADFVSAETIDDTLRDVRTALETVRNFGSKLANDLNIINTRQDSTVRAINVLVEGADDLVLADQNKEGAKLLALQTRQALATTALSLASQSQRSVIRLF